MLLVGVKLTSIILFEIPFTLLLLLLSPQLTFLRSLNLDVTEAALKFHFKTEQRTPKSGASASATQTKQERSEEQKAFELYVFFVFLSETNTTPFFKFSATSPPSHHRVPLNDKAVEF